MPSVSGGLSSAPALKQTYGRYEVRFRPPEAGLYFLFVEVASAGLPLQRSPSLALQVGAPEAGKPAGGQQP